MMAFPQSPALPQTPPRAIPRRSFATGRTVLALMLREMATTYGRSPGGYLWAVLEPVAGIALLTFVFSFALRTPGLGINFPLFYASGMIPFGIYGGISSQVAQSINYSRQLLAYPAVTFVDAILARFLLNMLTEIMVAYLIFGGIFLIFETRVIPNVPIMASAILLAGVLALGIGTLNCFLMTRFALWQRVWPILMRPLFFISCVFMTFDSVPRGFRDVLWYNPVVHVIGLMRRGIYSSYDAPYVSVPYVLGISLTCLTAGLVLLRRYHQELLDR